MKHVSLTADLIMFRLKTKIWKSCPDLLLSPHHEDHRKSVWSKCLVWHHDISTTTHSSGRVSQDIVSISGNMCYQCCGSISFLYLIGVNLEQNNSGSLIMLHSAWWVNNTQKMQKKSNYLHKNSFLKDKGIIWLRSIDLGDRLRRCAVIIHVGVPLWTAVLWCCAFLLLHQSSQFFQNVAAR